MKIWIAMLRGVNVGGLRVQMPRLKSLFEAAGCEPVTTYVQSGNVVFGSPVGDEAALVANIETRLANELGTGVPVLMRTSAQLRRVVRRNPYASQGVDLRALHVTFLAQAPDRNHVEALAEQDVGRDTFVVVGRVVYLYCPNGYGRTKLTNNFFERRLGTFATTRNWRTVSTLDELARTC